MDAARPAQAAVFVNQDDLLDFRFAVARMWHLLTPWTKGLRVGLQRAITARVNFDLGSVIDWKTLESVPTNVPRQSIEFVLEVSAAIVGISEGSLTRVLPDGYQRPQTRGTVAAQDIDGYLNLWAFDQLDIRRKDEEKRAKKAVLDAKAAEERRIKQRDRELKKAADLAHADSERMRKDTAAAKEKAAALERARRAVSDIFFKNSEVYCFGASVEFFSCRQKSKCNNNHYRLQVQSLLLQYAPATLATWTTTTTPSTLAWTTTAA